MRTIQKLIPWMTTDRLTMRNHHQIQNFLIEIGEKIDDDLLPLYKKLSSSSAQHDNKSYYNTIEKIKNELRDK